MLGGCRLAVGHRPPPTGAGAKFATAVGERLAGLWPHHRLRPRTVEGRLENVEECPTATIANTANAARSGRQRPTRAAGAGRSCGRFTGWRPGGARGGRGGSGRPVRLVVPGAGCAWRGVPPTDERLSHGVDRFSGFGHSRQFRAVGKLRPGLPGCPPPSRMRVDVAVDVAQVARPAQPDQDSASRQAQRVGRRSGPAAPSTSGQHRLLHGIAPGTRRPGTAPGEESSSRPRTRRTPAVP